jgi:hypothetical protein
MYQSRVSWFIFLLISGCIATAVSVAITDSTRSQVLRLIQRSLQGGIHEGRAFPSGRFTDPR